MSTTRHHRQHRSPDGRSTCIAIFLTHGMNLGRRWWWYTMNSPPPDRPSLCPIESFDGSDSGKLGVNCEWRMVYRMVVAESARNLCASCMFVCDDKIRQYSQYKHTHKHTHGGQYVQLLIVQLLLLPCSEICLRLVLAAVFAIRGTKVFALVVFLYDSQTHKRFVCAYRVHFAQVKHTQAWPGTNSLRRCSCQRMCW